MADRLEFTDGAGTVDCGPGTDVVFFDEGLDVVENCEILNPPLDLASVMANPSAARAALGR